MRLFLIVLIAFGFVLLFPVVSTGQSDNYTLFRKAIVALHEEYQAKKSQCQADYEAAKAKVSVYEKKPSVSVIGGTPEENERIVEVVEEALGDAEGIDESLDRPPLPATGSENKKPKQEASTTPQVKENPYPPIAFTSVAMFPDEPQGRQMLPKAEEKPAKLELISTEVFTDTFSIAIDDIQDPAEKKKWQEYAELEKCILELNRVGLIAAMHTQSSNVQQFISMQDELAKAGINLTESFMQAGLVEPAKQVDVLKKSLLAITTQILTR